MRSKGPMSRSPQHQMLSKMRRHPTTPRRVLSSFLARDALVRTNNQRIVALLPRCSYTSVCLRRHPRPQGITGNYREYIFRKIPPEIPQYLASFCIYFLYTNFRNVSAHHKRLFSTVFHGLAVPALTPR